MFIIIPHYFLNWFNFWNRIEVYNEHLIPKSGGVLIVSNHASYLDPPIIGVGARYRPVHFMARDTLWNNTFGNWWLNNVGCIPCFKRYR